MKILFIEDEVNAVMGLRAILESKKHMVDLAKTADEAVTCLRGASYELLILDITIDPGAFLAGVARREAGKELLLRLRANGISGSLTANLTPTVVITAVADLGVNTALRDAGATKILQKPIDSEDAFREIEAFLEHAAAGNPQPLL
jgi:DNA-binding response OmpR family regulator